ncbi:MAG: ankyrin repeat domain-containing protein [Gammaproteobacteria bacterium]|nr:ankyrin repeat domain-containing protein [Gammaproteobacteria bacterium]
MNPTTAFAIIALLLASPAAGGPVADAAMRGDLEAVRALLEQGADANEAQGDGMTALHWAARHADAEMAGLLITAGANLEAGTRIGRYTPLHLASRAGGAGVVEALLAAGAEVHAKTTNSGVTPLHLAAESGSSEAIRVLADAGADLNAREREWKQTPLIFAAARNRARAIRTLLDLGADVALAESVIEDVDRRATVDIAAQHRLYEVLAQFRPDWLENDPREDPWGPVDEGEPPTPGQVAVAIEAAREVQRRGEVLILDGEVQGISPISTNPPPGQPALVGRWGGLTPLLHAARAGHLEAMDALLDGGADIDQTSGDGTSPLLIAMLNGRFDLGLHLLDRGADPNVASDPGATPLYAVINVQWAGTSFYPQPRAHEAQKADYLHVMEALLQAGADPDARLARDLWWAHQRLVSANLEGTTPFFRAALGVDVAAMKLLVAYGADPDIPSRKPPDAGVAPVAADYSAAVDQSGIPPVPAGGAAMYAIHAATGVGYDQRAANEHRYVPGGWLPAVRYLVEELGADVNARDLDARTPLHNAASRGDNEVIMYLIERGADVHAVTRLGQTTVDMANSPSYNVRPFPATIALLERLGAINNDNCAMC